MAYMIGLVKVLTDSLRPNENHNIWSNSEEYSCNTNNNKNRISLTEPDIADIIAQLNQFYQKGIRDEFVYGLSGYLYKNMVKLESAEKILDLLCQTTNDEEHKNRITVLRNTYRKGNNGAPIAGYSSLMDIDDPEVSKKLERDSNADAFIDENGSLYQIETDALQKDPNKIRKLVLDSVDLYFSDDIYQELLNKFSQKNIYDLVTEKIRQFSNCRRSYDDNNELEES
ncbi:MAG: hypothetical protein WA421_19350 [Nitrososphaeraceae archaeon]